MQFKTTATRLLTAALAHAALADQPPSAWSYIYDGGLGRSDVARYVALSPGDTVTVTGISQPANGLEDFYTVRLDAQGGVVWEARYNGVENWIDVPKGIGVDAAGNTYVAGTTWGGRRSDGGSDWDYMTIKYAPDGTELWTRQYDGRGNWSDLPEAMTVSPDGHVYVAGFSFVEANPNGGYATHFHVVAYDTDGNQTWEVLYDLDPHFGAGARDITLDPQGNIIATGIVGVVEGLGTQDDILTVKISAAGQILWAEHWDSAGDINGLDDGYLVTTGEDGSVFVSGTSFSNVNNRNFDGTVLRYDADGNFQWSFAMDLPRPDGLGEVVADADGNLYIPGGWDNTADTDGVLISLTAGGVERWRHIYDGGSDGNFQDAHAVMMGPDGLLYVGLDVEYSDAAVYDYSVAVHDTDGSQLDQWRYDTGSNSDSFDSLGGWAMDPAGDIFVAGYSYFADTRFDFTVLRIDAGTGCAADFNGDGAVNTIDVLAFLNAWSAGDSSADFNGDGSVNTLDVLAFLNAWSAGC